MTTDPDRPRETTDGEPAGAHPGGASDGPDAAGGEPPLARPWTPGGATSSGRHRADPATDQPQAAPTAHPGPAHLGPDTPDTGASGPGAGAPGAGAPGSPSPGAGVPDASASGSPVPGSPVPGSPAGDSADQLFADLAAAMPGAFGPEAAGFAEELRQVNAQLAEATALAESRLTDLQRERADFVNYRRRTERDRAQAAVEGRLDVLNGLLGVLDDIEGARRSGELAGPFAAIADKLEQALAKSGLEGYGEVGEPFDPTRHEALLHDGESESGEPTCTQVLQRGYRVGERVLRPARVAVAGAG